MIEFVKIIFGSNLYTKSVILRDNVLRKPLGLVYEKSYLEAEKNEHHLAAVSEEEVLGILLLRELPNKTLKMRQVAINESYRRKGVGRKLVNFSEQFALENKFTTIELNARKQAIPFYKALKYNIVGSQFLELGIPHYRMIKKLI